MICSSLLLENVNVLTKEAPRVATLVKHNGSDRWWGKVRFFDTLNDLTLALTRNYYNNEYNDKQFIELMEEMKRVNPLRYAIEGEGAWGVSEGIIYQQYGMDGGKRGWLVDEFDRYKMLRLARDGKEEDYKLFCGLDFGFVDPTAFIAGVAHEKTRTLYICHEYYAQGATNQEIVAAIDHLGYKNDTIYADSADSRSINELFLLGLLNIFPAKKGSDSVLAGIQKLQDYTIVIHPTCSNFHLEISNYAWEKDRQTDTLKEKPAHDFSHTMDAFRYGTQDVCRDTFSFGVVGTPF